MVNAVLLNPKDMVVTVTEEIAHGEEVSYIAGKNVCVVKAAQAIPIYHKIAIASAKKEQDVIKYGEKIGVALQDFVPGEHVHTHNLGSKIEVES